MVNQNKTAVAYLIVVAVALAAIVKIVLIQFHDKPENINEGDLERSNVLECTRGSILSGDGRYLAYSIPEYRLGIDPSLAADTLFYNNIDGLSRCLADFYQDKKASQYKKLLTDARSAGKHFIYINRKLLTYQEMQEVSSFPILSKGQRRGGLVLEKVDHRTYPYGRLAYRTLGYIKDQSEKPRIGIEGSCDSILRGIPGSQPMRRTEGKKWIPDYSKEAIDPIDGTDVQLTLDIDMQDIAQRALSNTLNKTSELHAGTVILMEVATGEIKAMVNLEKDGHGGFDETLNYAIGRKGEPGSVFKAATLACLLEDGRVSLDTEVPATVNWQYGKRTFTDHYLDNYSTISVRRGFEISSNNVFRMLAAHNYDKDPDAFMNRLTDQMRITHDFPFELSGFAPANIKSTKNRSWNISDLPQTAMGYSVEITPLHTLNFYNALAGGGVMVRPHLVRNYQKDGVIVKEFPTEVLGTVCKESTAATLREAMRGVVEHQGGTGYRVFDGCPVEVAGKTGTARIVFPNTHKYDDAAGHKMHQATFVGFFPYSAPKYSMIVVVYSEPTFNNFYGATWSGPVFREIVENIYASDKKWNAPLESIGSLPERAVGNYLDFKPGETPNVVGMGLHDALLALEKAGYKVSFEGSGKVAQQENLADQHIKLKLKEKVEDET